MEQNTTQSIAQSGNVEVTHATYEVIAGKTDKEYTVQKIETGQYVVELNHEEDKSEVVTLDAGHCTCTFSDYNATCPHEKACRIVDDLN